MAVGSCFCGRVRIEYNGQPLKSGLCHCLDCRKISGSLFTFSYVVKSADLNISGSPKEVVKTADSGNNIRNYFCPDCGTPLFGQRLNPDGGLNEVTVVRAGIFDDLEMLNERKPDLELYTDRRLHWESPIEGAVQFSGMVPPP